MNKIFMLSCCIISLIAVIGLNLIDYALDTIIPRDLGMWIHLITMTAISISFWLRFYYSKRTGRRFIDEMPK